MKSTSSILLSVLLAALFLSASGWADDRFQLRDGDRVVLLGGAFVERLQAGGYLELELTSVLRDRDITFRNLGWSGDNVWGEARAVFGSKEDGFRRLEKDLREARPTVVIVAYGNNEAHRGRLGLDEFRSGCIRLFNLIDATKARILVWGPHRYERKQSPLPNPNDYNAGLNPFRRVLRGLAEQRGYSYFNLDSLFPRSPAAPYSVLTDNGVHLTPYGYWRVANRLAAALGADRPSWNVEVHVTDRKVKTGGAEVIDLKFEKAISFRAKDHVLPRPLPPKFSPEGAGRFARRGVLKVVGLQPGKYGLMIDGRKNVAATAAQWEQGVRLFRPAGLGQVEQLRTQIAVKNELYFHRYRPQNETYLFLFRKHEQGNNAVEIPQFDPLIEAREKQIRSHRDPKMRQYLLQRLGDVP